METDNEELFECVIPLPDALIRKPMDEPTKSVKHGDHDQSDHGSWAHGGASDRSGGNVSRYIQAHGLKTTVSERTVADRGDKEKAMWKLEKETRTNSTLPTDHRNDTPEMRALRIQESQLEIAATILAQGYKAMREVPEENWRVIELFAPDGSLAAAAIGNLQEQADGGNAFAMRFFGSLATVEGAGTAVMAKTLEMAADANAEYRLIKVQSGSHQWYQQWGFETMDTSGDPSMSREKVADWVANYRAGVTKSLKHGDHDQSDHGNWADGSGDGSKDNPIRTNSVEDAARALGEGKHVELRTPDQVAVLLDRLSELAKEAEAAGAKAKSIDLCNVTVPGTNLFCVESKGIPRVEMPQLKGIPNSGSAASDLPADKRGEVDITEAYLERLRASGVVITGDEALASHLKATQNELNGGKVAGIMQAARAGEIDLNLPIVVSKDGYIVDGHHRWAAKVALEHDGIDDPETDMKFPVVRVDQDILEILESSKQFAADMGLPQMAVKFLKHADHDQSEHGNWATGGARLNKYDGKFKAAGGTTESKVVATPKESRSERAKVERLRQKAIDAWADAKDGSDEAIELRAVIEGYRMMDLAYQPKTEYSSNSAVITAKDSNGKIVGALSYYAPEGGQQITAQFLGTSHEVVGTGTALMREAMQLALDENKTFAVLDPSEKARPWYESLGLGPLVTRHDSLGGERELYTADLEKLKEILGSVIKSLKHGDHDQSDHGNWAHGNAAVPELSKDDKKEAEKYLAERYPPDDPNRDSDLGKKLGLTSLEWAAADHYRTQGYMEVNNLLRGKGSDWGMEYAPADIRSVQLLDEAMDKSTVKDFETVYRGTSMLASKMDTFLSDLKVGGVYTDPSFTSTSRGEDIAESFATNRHPDTASEDRANVMWEIVLPPGTSALDMQSLFPNFGSNEEEVLLDRDTHLRILSKESAGVSLDGEPVYRVKAIAIPTTTKSMKHGDHDQSDHGNWATGGGDHQYAGKPRSASSSARMNEHTDRYGDPERRESGRESGSRNLGREVTYMEIVALESYKGGGYGEINRFLRGTQEGDDWTKDRIEAVKALAIPTTEPMTVTRMMPLFAVEGIAAGQVYEDKGFMSTGKGDHPAQFFHGYPVQMQIEVPAGTPVVDFDNFSGLDGWGNIEREVTLMPNSQLIIDRVEQRDWNRDFGPNETDGLKIYARLVPATKSLKHADHDQSDHGSWADGSVPLAKTPIVQVDALRSWSSNSYNMINGALRNPDTLGAQERGGLREPVQKMQDQLDKLFAGVPPTTRAWSLYRGATGDWVRDLVTQYDAMIAKGEEEYRATGKPPTSFVLPTFTDKGFVSTTPDKDVAMHFTGSGFQGGPFYTGDGRAMFEINLPEGSKMVNVDEYVNEFGGFAKFAAEESEFLLPRGLTFEVTDVTPSEDQFGSQGPVFYTIKLDVVPTTTKFLKHADHDQSDHGSWADGEPAEGKFNEDEAGAITTYTDQGHMLINGYLRTGYLPASNYGGSDDVVRWIENLDAAIESAGPTRRDMTIFRGVSESHLQELIDGGVLRDPGFASFSKSGETASEFATGAAQGYRKTDGAVLELDLPAGSFALDMESHSMSTEQEVLLPRDSRFELISGPEELDLSNEEQDGDNAVPVYQIRLVTPSKSYKHADHDQSDHGSWATGGGTLSRNAEKFKAAGGTIDKPVKATDSPRSDYAVATGLYGGGSGVRAVVWHWDDLVSKGVAADEARTKAEEANMNLWETTKLDIESPEYEKESERFQKAFDEADRLALGYKLTVNAITSTPFNEVIVARGADGSIVGSLAYYMPPDNSQFTVQLLGSTHEVAGTGTALMREAMGIALDKGVPFQVLDPVKDAQPWYESLGLGPLQMSDGDVYHEAKPLYRVEPDALREILGGSTKSLKHGDHDQSDHGNWAAGERYTAEARSAAEKALTHYSIDGYHRINSYLRKIDSSQDELNTGDFDPEPVVKEMDSLFNSAAPLKDPVTVFRGLDSEVAANITWRQGDIYTDSAFISTSLSEAVSERFTGYGGTGSYIMEIEVPAGTTALTPSMFASLVDEEEVILNRGTTLQITGTEFKDNFNYIYATVVPATKSLKHADHDQSDHGNWATGGSASPTMTQRQYDAVHGYTRNGYRDLNETLREGNREDREYELESERVKDLDALIAANFLTKDTVVYRGVKLNDDQRWEYGNYTDWDYVSKGEILQDGGYMSTTKSYFEAAKFMSFGEHSGQPIMFAITVPAGSPALDVSAAMDDYESKNGSSLFYPYESEILLPRETLLEITDKSTDENGRLVISATVIPTHSTTKP